MSPTHATPAAPPAPFAPRAFIRQSTFDNSPRLLAELRRLRKVPPGDTTRKKRTHKTNPSDALALQTQVPAPRRVERGAPNDQRAPQTQVPVGDHQPRGVHPSGLQVTQQRRPTPVGSRYPARTARTTFCPSERPATTTSMAAFSFSKPNRCGNRARHPPPVVVGTCLVRATRRLLPGAGLGRSPARAPVPSPPSFPSTPLPIPSHPCYSSSSRSSPSKGAPDAPFNPPEGYRPPALFPHLLKLPRNHTETGLNEHAGTCVEMHASAREWMGIEPTRDRVNDPSTALKAAGPTRRPDTPRQSPHQGITLTTTSNGVMFSASCRGLYQTRSTTASDVHSNAPYSYPRNPSATPTSSFTCETLLAKSRRSSSLSLTSMIFSTPAAPRTQGTPTK